MKRPTLQTINIQPIVLDIAQQIHKWCDGETSLEDTIISTTKILENNRYVSDGYELAKDFEDEGWMPDSQLVEILEDVFWKMNQQLNVETKIWSEKNSIKPLLDCGKQVKFKNQGKIIEGEIIKIDDKEAKYHIFMPSEGHVREGVGKHARIFKYEDVENHLITE